MADPQITWDDEQKTAAAPAPQVQWDDEKPPVTLNAKRGGSTVTSIPPPSLGDRVYDAAGSTLNNLYQVSAPGIALSFVNKYKPELGEKFGPLSKNAATPEELPGKIASTIPLMLGEDVPPQERPALGENVRSQAVRQRNAAPAERTTLGKGIDLASHVPGKVGLGAKLLRKFGVGDVPAPVAPTPDVPPWWGKRIGVDVGEPELWGKRVPEPIASPHPINVKLPGEVAPEMTRPRAYFGGVPPKPIPPRSGLALTGSVEGAVAPDEVIAPGKLSKAEIGRRLESGLHEGLGAEPQKPNVPLRQQIGSPRIPEATNGEATPIRNSTALKSYHYNPENQEFSVTTHDGTTHVYGEVTPEQAKAFSAADSKGKAWKNIRDNSTPVAKVVNGKRLPRIPTQFRSATPDDLTPDLEESLRQAKARKAAKAAKQ